MDFKPAINHFIMWAVIFGLMGLVVFLGGYLSAYFGKQMVQLAPESVALIDTVIMFFTIIVWSVTGALIALLFFYHRSVVYSFLNDRVVITKKLLGMRKEKTILYKNILDVEEHQNLFEKLFGLMHLVMITPEKQGFVDKYLWGLDSLPGIIIKSGIKKELVHRILSVK